MLVVVCKWLELRYIWEKKGALSYFETFASTSKIKRPVFMLRPCQPSDKPPLLALMNLNTPRYFAASEATDFADYLEYRVEAYFVVEEAQSIVGGGGINYFPEEATARMSWDMIHPDYQGKGIGRSLILHRIDEIKKNPSIRAIAVRTTQLTYRFYEKMGFELERTEQDFWARGYDLYQMKMPLVRV